LVFALEERKAIAEMIINGSVLEALQDGLRGDAHEPDKRMNAFLGAVFLTNSIWPGKAAR